MTKFNPYRDPLRQFNYTVVVGYNMLQLVKKGEDLTAKDIGKQTAITIGQLAAVYLTDKIVVGFIQRGLLQMATKAMVGVMAVYIGGAVVSTFIDEEEGLQNYNDFIDDVTSGDIGATGGKVNFTGFMIAKEITETDVGRATYFVVKEVERRVLGPFGLA
jgi:hypothetical protein